MLTRRKFIAYGGMAMAGAALGLQACAPASGDAPSSSAPDSQASTASERPASSAAAQEASSASAPATQPAHLQPAASSGIHLAPGMVVATEYAGNSVAVLDPGTLQVVQRIPAGQNPAYLAATAEAVYATMSGDGTLLQIPLSNTAAAKTIPTGSQPLAVCATDEAVVVADYHTSTLSVVDVALGSVVKTIPMDRMGYHNRTDPPECCRIYPGVGRRPVCLLASPDAGQVYALDYGTYDIACLDLATGQEVATFDGVVGPRKAVASPDGALLYVAGVGGEEEGMVSELYVIDRHTGSRVQKVAVGQGVSGVAVSPDGAPVMAISRDGGELVLFDAAFAEVGRCALSQGIDSLVLSADATRAFVGNSASGEAFAVDLQSMQVAASATGLASPKDLLVVA